MVALWIRQDYVINGLFKLVLRFIELQASYSILSCRLSIIAGDADGMCF
jgi:hypothetical protein